MLVRITKIFDSVTTHQAKNKGATRQFWTNQFLEIGSALHQEQVLLDSGNFFLVLYRGFSHKATWNLIIIRIYINVIIIRLSENLDAEHIMLCISPLLLARRIALQKPTREQYMREYEERWVARE